MRQKLKVHCFPCLEEKAPWFEEYPLFFALPGRKNALLGRQSALLGMNFDNQTPYLSISNQIDIEKDNHTPSVLISCLYTKVVSSR
jgi:hypothetical protein